jgi:hypothetical protein
MASYDYEFHYSHFPALKAYIDRIGAEQLNFRRFMVKEYHGSRYYIEKVLIKIDDNMEIVCRNKEYAPSEEEAEAIKAELIKTEFPKSIPAGDGQRDELLKSGVITGNLYTFYDSSRKSIIMCQERRETDNGKVYIPWTLYAAKGKAAQWVQLEPDGALPFWKPEKRRRMGSIMVHEGAKTAAFVDALVNDPERKGELKRHPWGDELSDYEHWGAIGGALAIHRCDYDELRREKLPGHIVYVCDNDFAGKTAVETFSRMYGGVMRAVKFDNAFPPGWDLADPVPPALFTKTGTVTRTLMAMAEPATWATKKIERQDEQRGRPGFCLTKNFSEEWVHTVKPEMYGHVNMTQYTFFAQDQFDHYVACYSDVEYVARLLKKSGAGKALTVKYDPGKKPGLYHDDEAKSDFFNLYIPPAIRDYTSVEAKHIDFGPFEEFIEYLIPDMRERHEVLKWCATLIAKPGTKMNYGMLMISETQGVGKTTLGADILGRLVGPSNFSQPNESSITGKFNTWAAKKRLAVCNEIYAGHSVAAYDRMKEVITDRVIKVEEKFVDEYYVDNHVHIFACSNSFRALKLDNADRRWYVPRVNPRKQSHEYYLKFHDWLQEDEGLRKVNLYFQQFVKKHGHVIPGTEAPWTQTKETVIEEGDSQGMAAARNMLSIAAETHSPGYTMEVGEGNESSFPVLGQLVRLARELKSFIMFDVDAIRGLQNTIYHGRQRDFMEKASTVRKIAKSVGLHVGEERVRATNVWGNRRGARVIAVDPRLAATSPSELAAMGDDLEVVDLAALMEEVTRL